MCRDSNELEKMIIEIKQQFLKEKYLWLQEKKELNEIIGEYKTVLYLEKNPDSEDGEASSFYDDD